MVDNDAIKRAAQLLLDGATMIQDSCPKCHSPLYRMKNGSLFCATCNLPVVTAEEQQQKKLQEKQEDINPIQAKIDQLGEQLLTETDLTKVKEIAATIKELKSML